MRTLRCRYPMHHLVLRLFHKNLPNNAYFECTGNLPTEKVTKRDLFRIFHRHGRLAQVSIKQAYGFVQFLDISSCAAALRHEQGSTVRGRKMRMISSLSFLPRGQKSLIENSHLLICPRDLGCRPRGFKTTEKHTSSSKC